ncbi:MAG TPA: hypothetical protein VK348_02240 [Planctomycetota bacterium]|nr:hypothetical protein [Planctomycetota bacterium]
MNLANNLFALSASLLLAATATAQTRTGGQTTLHRGSNYDRDIGNGWLGGAVHAHALMTTTTGVLVNGSSLDVGTNAEVHLLNASANIALARATANNSIGLLSSSRSGNFHVQVIGIDLINQNFTANTTFARQTWTFNAFGTRPSASIPVGPVSVSVSGNVGAGLTISAGYSLPSLTPMVGAGGYVQAYGFGDASAGVGIPGFSIGVGIEGRILEQDFTMFAGANALNGFFGVVSYTLVPVSLRLYVYAEAFWYRWTETLTTWSATAVYRDLF